MSITVTKIYTVTFTNKEEKTRALGFLLKSNFPFKGVDIDTIVIQKDAYDALLVEKIHFK
jgi:hypothetical protein